MGGKKKKQVIGYWYRLGVQMAVCHAPVDKITEILCGENVAWQGENTGGDIHIDKKELFGGEKREGGVAGRVGVNMGEKGQYIDRYIYANRGETSAQRGLLTLVFGDIGRASVSNTKAINFNMSVLSEYAEQQIGANPKTILTRADADMTRAQAETYIFHFYTPHRDNERDELGEQHNIYGTWRAVALYYAYRAYVLRNLPNSRASTTISAQQFFAKEARDEVIDGGKSEPFYWAAMNPYFKSVWVRVQSIYKNWTGACWYPEKAAIQGTPYYSDGKALPVWDMNPAHIIYNVLTNTKWGMGYSRNDIDEDSFKKAADVLYDEKFGLSLAWRKEEVIEEFLNIIISTIDAILRINIISGKFELLLIRDNYDKSKLQILDEDSIMELEKYERSSWGDTPNEVVLSYRDRMEDTAVITVQNLAAIDAQGGVLSTAIEYAGIHEAELAGRVAQRELLASTTPLAKVNLKVNRLAFLLQMGDVFILRWKELGIENLTMRIISINKGTFEDGTIQIEAIEDVFGMPDNTYITQQEVLWKEPQNNPTPIKNVRIWETPYYDIVNYVGEAAMQQGTANGYTFARVFVDAPNGGTPVFNLHGSNNDTDYTELSTSNRYTPNFNILDRINRTQTIFSITAIENLGEYSKAAYVVIGDEAMAIEAIDLTIGQMRVRRGVLDTIPQEHAIGTIGWIVEPDEGIDETFRAMGDTVYYKPLSVTERGVLPIAQQTATQLRLTGRQDKPIAPANVQINGKYFLDSISEGEDLNITWATRNRKRAILTDWFSGNQQSEEGVTYSIKIYDPNTNKDFYSETDIIDTARIVTAPQERGIIRLPVLTDLQFHYEFSEFNNGFSSKQGVSTEKAAAYKGDTLATSVELLPSLRNTKKLSLADKTNVRFNFSNEESFTLGLRVDLSNTAFSEVTHILKSERLNIYTQRGTLYVYIGYGVNNGYFSQTAAVNREIIDILVVFDAPQGKMRLWVNKTYIGERNNVIYELRKQYFPSSPENLWIFKNSVSGYLSGSTITSPDRQNRTSDFIAVEAGKKYYYQTWHISTSTWNGFHFYNANKRAIGSRIVRTASKMQDGLRVSSEEIIPPSSAAFIRIGSRDLDANGVASFIQADAPVAQFSAAPADMVTDNSAILGDNIGTYSSQLVIMNLFYYNNSLSENDIIKTNDATLMRLWSDNIVIEMKAHRDGLESHQTFIHKIKQV